MKFRDTVNERFRSLDDTTCSLEEFKQYVSLVRSRMFAGKYKSVQPYYFKAYC